MALCFSLSYLISHPGALLNNRYPYTEDLLALEAVSGPVPASVSGFIPSRAWEPYLASYPDQTLAAFLRRGFASGFRIGFNRSLSLKPARQNLSSVRQNPTVVDSYIEEELATGKLRPAPPTATVHVSPIGIIPKRNQPGKFRLIVDLSSPKGFSVNDGIDPCLCSLKYTSVAEAADLVNRLGKGALMAKIDLKSAYRMVPVHPQDQPFLGIEWRGSILVDQALPFGLRSAPKLFTAVADGLAWALSCEGILNPLHYLDDFFFCAPAESPACRQALEIAIPLCSRLGLPVAPNKVEGPTTCITFLGIQIDSERQSLSLPPHKLVHLKELIQDWKGRRSATKHQLQELVGHLNHAASVVRPGRSFLRALIEAMKRPRQAHQRTRLDRQCRADLAWWAVYLYSWNGISYFPSNGPHLTVVSDASGSWGCGALNTQSGEWFQVQWPESWSSVNIAVKEMIPIVVATALWGTQWCRRKVHFLSDNMAVVATLNSRSARHLHLSHLLRCLFFLEAHYDCGHSAGHIAGRSNIAADALSRNSLPSFFSSFPQARPTPTPVPVPVISLLTDPTLSWTDPRWERLFKSILSMV